MASKNKPILENRSSRCISDSHILINDEYRTLLLEEDVWMALYLICNYEKMDVSVLISHINSRKQATVSLENACRVFVLSYYLKNDLSDNAADLAAKYKTYIAQNNSASR